MPKYDTKQRRVLILFLSQHPDEHFTAKQIAKKLSSEGISLSAVYRNLSLLESEGLISRCKSDSAREASYRYMGADQCRHKLHLSCKKCGKTFHMHSLQSDRLISSIMMSENFKIDREETVLYGVCKSCQA